MTYRCGVDFQFAPVFAEDARLSCVASLARLLHAVAALHAAPKPCLVHCTEGMYASFVVLAHAAWLLKASHRQLAQWATDLRQDYARHEPRLLRWAPALLRVLRFLDPAAVRAPRGGRVRCSRSVCSGEPGPSAQCPREARASQASGPCRTTTSAAPADTAAVSGTNDSGAGGRVGDGGSGSGGGGSGESDGERATSPPPGASSGSPTHPLGHPRPPSTNSAVGDSAVGPPCPRAPRVAHAALPQHHLGSAPAVP